MLLQTIPGIDRMGAAMLLVEISADMQNFGSAERLASWMGICPGNNESAGKRKSGKTRKGNAWVRRLLCEFAQAASGSRCAVSRPGRRLRSTERSEQRPALDQNADQAQFHARRHLI